MTSLLFTWTAPCFGYERRESRRHRDSRIPNHNNSEFRISILKSWQFRIPWNSKSWQFRIPLNSKSRQFRIPWNSESWQFRISWDSESRQIAESQRTQKTSSLGFLEAWHGRRGVCRDLRHAWDDGGTGGGAHDTAAARRQRSRRRTASTDRAPNQQADGAPKSMSNPNRINKISFKLSTLRALANSHARVILLTLDWLQI